MKRTTVLVTSLSGTGWHRGNPRGSHVPWVASGIGIKARHTIRRPVSIGYRRNRDAQFRVDAHTEWDCRSGSSRKSFLIQAQAPRCQQKDDRLP